MRRLGWGLLATGMAIAIGLAVRACSIPPAQPIAFSHEAHAGRRQISCTYCHTGATTTAHALIPDTATCVDCHRVVRTDRPDVQRLLAAYSRGESLRWRRVTNLPDYVRFTHRRHVQAGVACASCHGDVAAMPVVYKANALNMGQCLSCHTQRRASTDCLTCHY